MLKFITFEIIANFTIKVKNAAKKQALKEKENNSKTTFT